MRAQFMFWGDRDASRFAGDVVFFRRTPAGPYLSVELLNILLIFVALTLAGLCLSHRKQVGLGDPKLKILGTFWLLKVIITLLLLCVGWMPQLDLSSASWGYDPQRFHIDAWDLIGRVGPRKLP